MIGIKVFHYFLALLERDYTCLTLLVNLVQSTPHSGCGVDIRGKVGIL